MLYWATCFDSLLSHLQALQETDPSLSMFIVHSGIQQAFGIPECTININKLWSVSWRAWRWLKRRRNMSP